MINDNAVYILIGTHLDYNINMVNLSPDAIEIKNPTLQRYAAATHTHIVHNLNELAANDMTMEEMREWCAEKKDLVVLKSGTILSADPASRRVQNCKSVMLSKGIYPGLVFAATPKLIAHLLAMSEKTQETAQPAGETPAAVSEQQRQLRELVGEAARRQVSVIHIEVRQKGSKVRMRQRGELQLYAEWPEQRGREIASVVQEVPLALKIEDREFLVHSARVPAPQGFDVVIHLLESKQDQRIHLEALGYTPGQLNIIKTAMAQPFGAILIAGPSGSGKTTSLAAFMDLIDESKKIYALEDSGFSALGQAALRMDPNVLILGELKDEESAAFMATASLNGCLVLSTLQTPRATSMITALLDLKLSPRLISDRSVLRCLCSQRLAAKLCSNCAIPLRKSRNHQTQLLVWEEALGAEVIDTARVRGQGCSQCRNSGIGGLLLIAEMIYLDDEGRQFILKEDLIGWEAYLKSKGWQSIHDRALDLIAKGMLDPSDAERILGPLTPSTLAQNWVYQN